MSWFQTFSVSGGQLVFLLVFVASALITVSIPSFVYLIIGVYFFNQI